MVDRQPAGLTGRWWWRPARAALSGVAAGLGFLWVISGLPFPESLWAVLGACLLGMAWCVWQLIDVRRLQREVDEKVADWKRQAGADWPE